MRPTDVIVHNTLSVEGHLKHQGECNESVDVGVVNRVSSLAVVFE